MSYSAQQFTSRRQQNWGRNQNTTRYTSNVKLGPVAHTVLVALMITVLGLIYLIQATKATSFDYEINRVDTKISELASKKDDLEIENARLTSLNSTKNSSVAREMSPPSSVTYAQ
jgi:cell division protein FtsL